VERGFYPVAYHEEAPFCYLSGVKKKGGKKKKEEARTDALRGKNGVRPSLSCEGKTSRRSF